MDKGNRKIEALISQGAPMMVDNSYADAQLAKYLMAIEARGNGVSLAELGIFSEKDNSKPYTAKADNGKSVSVIPLRGFMQMEDGLCIEGARAIVASIEAANNDTTTTAIVMSINTGGGEALAGQAIGNAIRESKKPILVSGEFIASAGYLAAAAADEVFLVGDMSEVGSIGVMTSINMAALTFYKENIKSIYATKSDNKNEEQRDMLDGNFGKLTNRLDRIDEVFMSIVKAERELKGNVDETLSGRLFMAQDAIANGLIDGVATLSETINMAARMPKRKKINKKSYTMSFKEVLQGTRLGAILFGSDTEITLEGQVDAINAHAKSFEAMQTQMTDLLATVGTLKTEQSAMFGRIAELEAANETLAADLKSAKAVHAILTSENETLKAAILEKDGVIAAANLKLQGVQGSGRQAGVLVKQSGENVSQMMRF